MGFRSWYGRVSLANKITIAMILGALIGFIVGPEIAVLEPIGTIFIRLLKMVALPVIFFSITTGASGIVNLSRFKKIGSIFLMYWALSTLLSAATGLTWAAIIKPGAGIKLAEKPAEFGQVDILQAFVKWIPDNVVAAFANYEMIQVVILAILVGIAAAFMGETDAGRFMRNFFQSGAELSMKLTSMIMEFTPYGVFALMAAITGTTGTTVLGSLAKMVLTQYITYATIMFVIYPLILIFYLRLNPIQYYRNVYPAMVVAFTTCSSAATLPVAMEVSKKRLGVPEDMVNLIMPIGAAINQHAIAAELPIYVLWVSQMYGMELTPVTLVTTIVMGMILGSGGASVPGGAVVLAATLLQTMGLPMTVVPWIAGIYRLIDMPNTMLNVVGDPLGGVIAANALGELDRDIFYGKKRVDETK
ncbi:dicarboxylate/amino acid:cation symporter [Thermosediminibacter oceani]|uniref:Sodium:dicarboxylate symporter n=1 Tax=Thermosediminibacter oceani (strain ATCC BAA-1034 / DSM 16646 / JW/IW-1228P) TaxID=555079 RepID=D9S0P9_THEOJ|nr:dicarboxylate/amino acid:cation symporter [Thermosediminibacter oceani]ADL08907.1 sodium:dicarboxylate symporter [Thermosediminibacter oceani DSM 16646]